MFITFEGIDGSGKSTQLKLLAEYLVNHNKKVITLREPGGTQLAESIRDILLSTKQVINPIAELLLFEAARSNLIEQIIKPALAAGTYILCDRFIDSTTAYQGYGRGLNLMQVTEVNQIATAGLKPDLTFYLKITHNLAINRFSRRTHDRIESAGEIFFKKVIDGYDILASEEPNRIKIINADGSIIDTKKLILQYIKI
jgi:dTMP kinase